MQKRFLLLALIALLAIILGFFSFGSVRAVWMVKEVGYWLILASTCLFGFYLTRSLRGGLRGWTWAEWRWPVVVIALAAVFLHIHERHEFKIVMDEVVLQATAMDMHFDRQASASVKAYDFGGNFISFKIYVDKRPLFFPFLLSTVHDLTGYRVENVFWLNGALSLVLTTLTYLVGRRVGGLWAGVVAVLLLISVPLVNQNAVGGGFELLNLTMIVCTLWLGMRHAEAPSDDRLSAFLLSGILLAQVRYESVLFLLPVGVTILYVWWHQRTVKLPWALIFAPLLLVVYPWQYNVFKLADVTWQLNDIEGAAKPFGVQYFYDNVGHALNFFLCFDGSQPSSWWLGILGAFGVGFFGLMLYKEHRTIFVSSPVLAVLSIFLIGLILHTVFMLCYFWGRWDDPLIRRLSLPAHLLLIFALVYVFPRLIFHRRAWQVLTGATLLYIWGVTVPVSARHCYTQENFAARTNNWVSDYITQHLDGKRVLAIDGNEGLQWIIHRQSSIMPAMVADESEKYLFHYKNHSFDDYLVVQRWGVDVKNQSRYLSVEDDLGDAFKLELIDEKAFSPIYVLRLSRVLGVDEAKLKAWKTKREKIVPLPASAKAAIRESDAENLSLWLKQLP